MNINVKQKNTNTSLASAAVARTPYHALSDDMQLVVPDWAGQRSVYRSSGRTMYLVDTDQLSAARGDLKRLARAGWDVQVAKHPAGAGARIALSRRDLARAA